MMVNNSVQAEMARLKTTILSWKRISGRFYARTHARGQSNARL